MRLEIGNWKFAQIIALFVALSVMPVVAATYRQLPEQTKAALGATHIVTIEYSDLTETNASTAQSLTNIVSIPAKRGVQGICAVLTQPFGGGTTNITSIALKVGDGTDDDLYLSSTEIAENATEEYFKWGNWTFNSASTTIAAWTNATGSATKTYLTNSWTYLNASSNVVTNSIIYMSDVSVALTPETGNALNSYSVSQGNYVYTNTTPLKFTFTPTGISGLSTLTNGEVKIYLRVLDQGIFK
jgi:hypothetical protein